MFAAVVIGTLRVIFDSFNSIQLIYFFFLLKKMHIFFLSETSIPDCITKFLAMLLIFIAFKLCIVCQPDSSVRSRFGS